MIKIIIPINSQLLLAFCLLLPMLSWGGADDDYLKMIEAEAESSLADPESNESRSKGSVSEPESDLIPDRKELIAGVSDFNKALKSEYPESYKMYVQFNKEQKKTVYDHFTQRKRLYNTNLKIISIYLKNSY